MALITLPDALALPRTAGHGLGRRVLRDAVRPPAYPGIPMDQDADAPHGDAQDDEQMNRFHECRMGETPNPGNL